MDLRTERIESLKKSFDAHPAASFLRVKLEKLEMLYENLSHSVVTGVAIPEFMVHCDLDPGLIVQGGISFAIANFAGVYAAMVHTEKHTPLVSVNQISYTGRITTGEELIAHATARRQGDLFIFVSFELLNKDGNKKLAGNSFYRDAPKK